MRCPDFLPRIVFVVTIGATAIAHAAVKLPAIFGDHMVLQQEATLPVWGVADPGEKVTVNVAAASMSTVAGADGKWRVDLPTLPAGTPPVTMTVNSLKFEDVLVGEVWLCAGQSNMAFRLPRGETAGADDSEIRFYTVPLKTALEPQGGLGSSWVWERDNPSFLQLRPEVDVRGQWVVCTPATAGEFSAVGYYFARQLRGTLKRPVGLIGAYWVGSSANSWVSLSGLQKEPTLKGYTDTYEKVLSTYSVNEAALPARRDEYRTALKKWEDESNDARKKSQDAGQPAPPKPDAKHEAPELPMTPDGGPRNSTTLFNGMIAPLMPYAIKGVAWYQGESNHARGLEYQTLLARLITDWRERWGEGAFPFLIVQLPNGPGDEGFSFVRESQLKVSQAVPNTGMAVTIDIGDPNDGHPHNKVYVGLRLAEVARHVAYGQTLVCAGPIYDGMKVDGNTIRLSFTYTDGGLVIGSAPYLPAHTEPIPTTKLAGFSIAGADQKWVPADATIEGTSVAVSSPEVAHPVAVRYAWGSSPRCNLYNGAGWPASPFRTDDWEPTFRHDDWNLLPYPRTLTLPPKN